MPYEYSDAYKEAVASVDSRVAYIFTYSFFHSTFPSTYRFAISDVDLIIEGTTYKGKQIKSSGLSVGKDGNTSINISVSNVTSTIFNIFRNSNKTSEPVLIELKGFIPDQPTATASFSTKLFAKPVIWNGSDMSMSAGYPDSTNLKLPKVKYTTRKYPGLRN